MRRRWALTEDQIWAWGMGLWAGWLFSWLFIWIGLHATIDGGLGHHKPMHWPSIVALILMGTPTILIAVGGSTYLGWRHRPRRVLEPIKEDLRKASGRHQ